MKTIKLFLIPALILGSLSQILLAQHSGGPEVTQSVFFFESKPIRDIRIVFPGKHDEDEKRVVDNKFFRGFNKSDVTPVLFKKPLLQRNQGTLKGRGPMLNFEGVGNVNNWYPADPNGDIGPNHYIQIVNSSFAIWDKSGNLLYGPVDNQTIWASFPGPWNNYYWFDPIIKYDQFADRWVISSMSYNGIDFYTMIAVSTTPDPIGSYYCYGYYFTDMNDYPKLSVWPDGYYITYNFWDFYANVFLYSLVTVVDRDAMLNGAPSATMIQFQIPNSADCTFYPIPADLRGTLMPCDSPCYIVTPGNHDPGNLWHFSLDVYSFNTDWNVPANSTLDCVSQFDIGDFEPMTVFGPGAPQMGSSVNVMTIPIYMMHPLTYRMFSDHEAMVCCHTMWDGEIHYIKWYELRRDSADWYVYQTGNYAPGDAHYFIPSISINANGVIALGYSISSEEMYPSIHYTGRRAEDSLGIMSFQEMELYKGLNYANTFDPGYEQNRWGDYSSMMVDPSDDSTFWYTNMYTTSSTSTGNWATRIFSLNLSEEPVLPYANAGNDTLTCDILFFETQGHAENYSSIIWITSGDGNFISNYLENATYLRGPGDLENKQVTLTMHLTGYQSGTEATDSMILYLNKDPEVYAGPDTTIYGDEPVTLQGEVSYAYKYFWATLGDGAFTDSTNVDAIYTPGQQDIINQGVTLVLTANEVSPCTGSVRDSVTITILPVGINDLSGNQLVLNIFPNPANDIISVQAETPTNDLLILQVISNDGKIIFTGKFYPVDKHSETRFDLSYLLPGIYFIRLQTGDKEVTRKLAVQKN